ncbi:MAG: response regulator [Candidatus Competibacteraceae bacterium]|nr:response regulator [Candidatus Competibacteraceae bacterium]
MPDDRLTARIAAVERQLDALEQDFPTHADGSLALRVRELRAAWQALRETLERENGAEPSHSPLPAWPEESLREEKLSYSRRRILVVDDNREVADALAMLLKVMGHQVEVARSGEKALEAARAFDPQLVFLDIGLPGIDGYEVARQLRHMPRELPLTLVALTGHGRAEDRLRAQEIGFDHFLLKPADLNKLEALVDGAP